MVYKVLIADDEPIVRKAMQTLIEWEKLECDLIGFAANGQEVMEMLGRAIPDILILDVQMPGVSGIELAKYVWEKKLSCKVILLTAYADFSYAQSAVKYDVIDYVIKTGAFDDLVVVIEKAKDKIKLTEFERNVESKKVLKENFFKSVFDGSLYLQEDIRKKADKADISLVEGYLVIVCHFRAREDKERSYTYSSLQNFFHMVFDEKLVYSLAVDKDVMAIILDHISMDFYEDIHKKCEEVIEIMDNFMKMYVYMGISNLGNDIFELKQRYEEAESAEGESFFNDKSKINYFQERKKDTKELLEHIEKGVESLQYWMKKGNSEEAMKEFDNIIKYQMESGGSVATILEVGICIYASSKKMLSDMEKTLYDITLQKESFSKSIYRCRHISEYYSIMRTVIESTAEYIKIAASRRNILIYECEKYIDENYERGITVSEISRYIGVSMSYLSRIFKDETGNTIINYINEKKIQKAKEYLGGTDMKIYEIAEKLGFENTTYFSYFFKKYTGISPKEYKTPEDSN